MYKGKEYVREYMRDYRLGIRRHREVLDPEFNRKLTLKAVEELYEQEYYRVVGLMYYKCKDRETAHDLAQEVFVKILNHADEYREEGKMKAWMNVIANNAFLSHIRKIKTRSKHDITYLFEKDVGVLYDLIPDSFDCIEDFESKQRFAELLSHLSKDLSIVTKMFYYDDLSEKEISFRLGIPIGTVASRLYLAREALRATLRQGS